MTTLDDVLLQLRQMSQTTREQGDYFERLIVRVLKVSPWYKDQFSNVWLWRDWPDATRKLTPGLILSPRALIQGNSLGFSASSMKKVITSIRHSWIHFLRP
jgi:predicted helicase